MNILQQIQSQLTKYNQKHNIDFNIDTIRVEFSKQHKLPRLEQLGSWKKALKNDYRLNAAKRRDKDKQITSIIALDKYPIYYANKKDPTGKCRKAEMVIFGMKQYHKDPPPEDLVDEIIKILTFKNSKNNINVDICYDLPKKPNLQNLETFFDINQYWNKDTYYINEIDSQVIEKIVIYNKQKKNNLDYPLWRIEAKIQVNKQVINKDALDDFYNVTKILYKNGIMN